MSLAGAIDAGVEGARSVIYAIEINGEKRLGCTPAEAAPLLGISYQQVTKWCREGVIRHRKIGRLIWIPVSALQEFQAGDDRAAS